MYIWCEYDECSLSCSGAITLTSCYDLEGQDHELEDQGQGLTDTFKVMTLKIEVTVTDNK